MWSACRTWCSRAGERRAGCISVEHALEHPVTGPLEIQRLVFREERVAVADRRVVNPERFFVKLPFDGERSETSHDRFHRARIPEVIGSRRLALEDRRQPECGDRPPGAPCRIGIAPDFDPTGRPIGRGIESESEVGNETSCAERSGSRCLAPSASRALSGAGVREFRRMWTRRRNITDGQIFERGESDRENASRSRIADHWKADFARPAAGDFLEQIGTHGRHF